MATSFSPAARLALATPLYGGTTFVGPANYQVALFTGDPNSPTSPGVECTGIGYGRVAIVNDAAAWVNVAGSNNRLWRLGVDLVWTPAGGAGTGWGRPDWLCFFDAATGQKVWATDIANPVTIDVGTTVHILANQLTQELLN